MTLLTDRLFSARVRRALPPSGMAGEVPAGAVVEAYGLRGKTCLVWHEGVCRKARLSALDLINFLDATA